MKFWIFMLVSVLLIPLTMLIFGKLFINSAPRTINSLFGYRTRMSMLNQETWVFAHKYMGQIWFRLGRVLLPISILAMLPLVGKDENAIGNIGLILALVQLIALLVPIYFTEKALRIHFDSKGNPRS